jgi:hypothetical protein
VPESFPNGEMLMLMPSFGDKCDDEAEGVTFDFVVSLTNCSFGGVNLGLLHKSERVQILFNVDCSCNIAQRNRHNKDGIAFSSARFTSSTRSFTLSKKLAA